MLSTIIKDIQSDLEALSIVEQFGGLVTTLQVQVGDQDDIVTKRYPVGCGVTAADCNNQSIYTSLVPDDSKASIVYFEEVTPMAFVDTFPSGAVQKNSQVWEGTVRMVVWTNAAKLGYTNATCRPTEHFISPLIYATQQTNRELTVQPFENWRYSITFENMVAKNLDIFSQYDYDELKNFYLYPYDYCAMEFRVRAVGCFSPDVAIGSPINCISWA